MRYSLFSIFVFIGLLSNLNAQDDSLYQINRDILSYENIKPFEVNNLAIVSASRSSKKILELPVTVYVITHEDIINNGYVTLVDVLKAVPGIRVSQPGNGEQGETFMQRGLLGNNYTKILINNIPIQPSVTQGMSIDAQLPIRQAERIEIIYGPASAIYGADAASGVINIITKEAAHNSFALADACIGTNQYYYVNFMAGGKAGRNKNILQYSIYGSKLEFGNLNNYTDKDNVYNPNDYYALNYALFPLVNKYTNDTILISPSEVTDILLSNNGYTAHEFFKQWGMDYEGTIAKPDMSKLSQQSNLIGVNLKYRGLTASFNHMYRSDHSSIGKSPTLYKYNNPNNFMGSSVDLLCFNYSFGNEIINSSTNLSYLSYRMDNASSKGLNYSYPIVNVYPYEASDDISFEQVINFKPFKRLELTGGFTFQYSGNLPVTNENSRPFNPSDYSIFSTKEIQDSDFGKFGYNPLTFFNYGGFFQIYYTIWRFSFILGARNDYNSRYSDNKTPELKEYKLALNPRVGLVYKIHERSALRSSIAFAYKAPPASMMYYSIASKHQESESYLMYHFVPNPDLKPEAMFNYEFGYRYTTKSGINFDVSLFSNIVSNRISPAWVEFDTTKYIGVPENSFNNTVRTYINDEEYISAFLGIQTTITTKDLIPSIHFNPYLTINWATGTEKLPGNGGEIEHYRQIPDAFYQFGFDFIPYRKFYVRLESIYSKGWYRLYLRDSTDIEKSFFKIKGYKVFDLYVSYNLSKNLKFYIKILNLFDEQYGGLDATGLDVDLRYNPQLRRNIRAGFTYQIN